MNKVDEKHEDSGCELFKGSHPNSAARDKLITIIKIKPHFILLYDDFFFIYFFFSHTFTTALLMRHL